jgi:putative transposase
LQANRPITPLFSTFGVSTSGCDDSRERREHPPPRTTAYEVLAGVTIEINAQSRGTYGSRRVHAELRLGEGIHVGIRRAKRLMRNAGIAGVFRRRKHWTTRRDPKAALNDDLVNRQLSVDRPDALWVSDVTERPTAEDHFYLATVTDAY